jgi:integrase
MAKGGTVTDVTRTDYGSGSLYQRKSDWRWVGAIDDGWTATGARRRAVVTTKGCVGGCKARCPHVAEIKRRLKLKARDIARGEQTASRVTVKAWATTYLAMRVRDLSPKGYNATANPIKNWIVPTIGHRRLDQLTPADVRAVHDACRRADRQSADVHRVLRTMLNAAVAEGHTVSPRVLAVKAPKPEKSDRTAMTLDEGIACLEVAADHPRGVRWAFTLLSGARLGECLGLTWDAVDLDAGEAIIEWQLQALPYNVHRDRSSGFRVPDGHEARHLVDAYHLVRPKSRKGYRVAPLLPFMAEWLRQWQQVAPANPWGLVWPGANGRPANDKHDRAEWWALQDSAGVSHPSGRPYHVHECRNFAATMLLEADVSEHVVTDLLGHTAVATSLRYRTARREPLREAMERAFAPLALNPPATS